MAPSGIPRDARVTGASAERIENQVAVFSALDKLTAQTSSFEVELGKTKTFGSVKVTPRVCYSRPPTEQPKTTTFVEVDEVQLDGTDKRIFTGWMFAESPGLYAVENPTFDVWLTACRDPMKSTAQAPPKPRAPGAPFDPDGEAAAAAAAEQGAAPADSGAAASEQEFRRRIRR